MPRRYGSTAEDHRLLDVALCDHYDDYDDDEDGGGSGGGVGGHVAPTKRKRRVVAAGRGRCGDLLRLLLLPLLLLTSVGLYYSYAMQRRLASLSSDLKSATDDLAALRADGAAGARHAAAMNATLANHSAFLARFEEQISNSDVLHRLDELEVEEHEMEGRVEEEMATTKEEIRGVLGKTKSEIDKSVRCVMGLGDGFSFRRRIAQKSRL